MYNLEQIRQYLAKHGGPPGWAERVLTHATQATRCHLCPWEVPLGGS